jgi:single-strand DNA-binding protein
MYKDFITIAGRLTSDPEVSRTSGGATVVKFGLATNERAKDSNGDWRDGHTNFYSVSRWRETGERAAESLRKGDPVVIYGRLQIRTYERRDGGKGTEISLEPEHIGPDLKWVSAAVMRRERRTPESQTPEATEAPSSPDPWTSSLPSEESAA